MLAQPDVFENMFIITPGVRQEEWYLFRLQTICFVYESTELKHEELALFSPKVAHC